MAEPNKIRVAVNGYGVIGKRVAAAVALQADMTLAGVSDVATITGSLDDLLAEVDVVVDCTPKRIAAKNIEVYRHGGLEFILQGGEKHEATGHSFVADLYEVALWADMLRVQGDELFYAYMVDNQAIVIPETIDAIRALTGLETDPNESIRQTNAALGIETSLI